MSGPDSKRARHSTDSPRSSGFTTAVVEEGVSPVVATELDRRLSIIEEDELQDTTAHAWSVRQLAGYVGVTVGLCLLGILLVIL